MERVTCNLAQAPRRETWNGREYVVAPMTMLVEGVLKGSRGALFYPRREIERTARDWEDVPITYGHPVDPTTNENVSAADPKIREALGIGVVRKPAFEGDRLKAEGWFDRERTRKLDPELLAQLEAGRAVELSTGLHTEDEDRPGTFNGRAYAAVATKYRPDHLAVLTTQPGACSRLDGCGVNNSSDQPSDDLDLTPEKACRILQDGEANGKPLTDAQKGMFGAKCGERGKATSNGKKTMKLNRDQMLRLTTNCDCWKSEASRQTLNALSDDQLSQVALGILVNAVMPEGTDGAAQADPREPDADDEDKKKLMSLMGEYDEDTLKAAQNMLRNLKKNLGAMQAARNVSGGNNAGCEPDDGKGKPMMTGNRETFVQLLEKHGTPQEKAVWNAAVAGEYEQRAAKARQMTANLQANDRDREFQDLMKMDPGAFQDFYARWQRYHPQGAQQTVAQPGQPLFIGNAGGPWGVPSQPQAPLEGLDLHKVREDLDKQRATQKVA